MAYGKMAHGRGDQILGFLKLSSMKNLNKKILNYLKLI